MINEALSIHVVTKVRAKMLDAHATMKVSHARRRAAVTKGVNDAFVVVHVPGQVEWSASRTTSANVSCSTESAILICVPLAAL